MERLTKRVGVYEAVPDCDFNICEPFEKTGQCKTGYQGGFPLRTWERHCNDTCILGRMLDRLAAYEDTGLTPDEVVAAGWVSVSERLPLAEYEEHRRKWGTDPDFIVVISGAEESTTLHFGTDFKDRFCWYDEDTTYSVSHWMNWPMPPKEDLK